MPHRSPFFPNTTPTLGGEEEGRTNTRTRTPLFSRIASFRGLRFQARSEPCRGGPLPEKVQEKSKLCALRCPGAGLVDAGACRSGRGGAGSPGWAQGDPGAARREDTEGRTGQAGDLPGHVGSGQPPPPPPAPPPALCSSAFAPRHGRAACACPRRRLRAANLIPPSSGRRRGSPPDRCRRPVLVRPAQSRARKWRRVSE